MKHGLAGQGACTLELLKDEVQVEYHLLAETLRPQNHLEHRLVEQAALATIQALRAQAQSEAETRQRADDAIARHDADREAEVDAAIRRLAGDPTGALATLLATTEGCDALADEWEALKSALEDDGGAWDGVQTERALQLLGSNVPPTIHSEPHLARTWHLALGARREENPARLARFFDDPEACGPDLLPEADGARVELLALVEAELVPLRARADGLWDGKDRARRAGAVDRVLRDVTAEGQRLHRYQVDGINLMQRSLKALTAHRKEQARLDKAGGLPPPGFASRNEAKSTARRPGPTSPNPEARQEVASNPPVAAAADPPAEGRPEAPVETRPDPAASRPGPADVPGGPRNSPEPPGPMPML